MTPRDVVAGTGLGAAVLARLLRRLAPLWGLCAAGAGSACGQLLNPGFERQLEAWTPFGATGGAVTVTTSGARSGASALRLRGAGQGDPSVSGVFESLPARGGQLWRASAWAQNLPGDPLAGTNRVVLKIEFYRVTGGVWGTPDMLAEHEVLLADATAPLGLWQAASLQVRAPDQTVEARVALVFIQIAGAGGTLLVDDVELTPVVDPQVWSPVFVDEFDGPAVDDARWRIEDLHLNKNNELQYYTPQDVYIQGGKLVLRSQQRDFWGYDDQGNWRLFHYTSGLVETRDRFATAYGRIDVRAKLPRTRGLWPAHWMLPDSRQWPPEIDIMEMLGHQPTRIYMTHHWGTWPNVQSHGGTYDGPDYSQDFHIFSIIWSPNRIDWLIDDIVRFTSTIAIPEEPFYLILNTAVGGDFPGNPDSTSVFPQFHEIDYVRVYVPADPGPAYESLVDPDPQTALADGVLTAGEYALQTHGINSGLFGMIGQDATFYIDTSAAGRLNFAVDSATAWPTPGAYGAVMYIDCASGGLPSTVTLRDNADAGRRLVSGFIDPATWSNLYFAAGMRADYAIALLPERAEIYRLDPGSLTLINAADLNAETDMFGGQALRYMRDDGSLGGRLREVGLDLAQLGMQPGDAMRFVVSLMNTETGFRANEFVGVAPGNPWDTFNPGIGDVVLKRGDFIEFTTVGSGCGQGCQSGGAVADIDGDCDVDVIDLSLLLGSFGQPTGATHAQGDTDFDGDVDLQDLANVLNLFGANCW